MNGAENMQRYWRSRYTLAEEWDGGKTGILLNTFSGAVDYVSSDVIKLVRQSKSAMLDSRLELDASLVHRGYYVRSLEHEDAAARRVGEHSKASAVASNVAKYMFGLTLRCNLTCSYCWQVQEFKSTRQKTAVISEELIEAAFDYIDFDMKRLGKDRGVVSLFGGEPLIDRPQYHRLVEVIGENAAQRGLSLHFTTNGRSLSKFMTETERFRPSIQVTVDGLRIIDGELTLMRAKQPLPGLLNLLLEIAERGLSAGVFLRFLVDEIAISQFIALADHVQQRGRFGSPLFKLGVAPLQNKAVEENVYVPKHAILKHLLLSLKGKTYARHLEFVDWRSLSLLGELRSGQSTIPLPAFYHCEANTDLTCFDQDGYVYACYEAIGDHDMSVGRYWPTVQINANHLSEYRDRSAFTMEQCTECPVSPICGGGCEVRGRKHNGAYALPYCDDLHEEIAFLLKNWSGIIELLGGKAHAD